MPSIGLPSDIKEIIQEEAFSQRGRDQLERKFLEYEQVLFLDQGIESIADLQSKKVGVKKIKAAKRSLNAIFPETESFGLQTPAEMTGDDNAAREISRLLFVPKNDKCRKDTYTGLMYVEGGTREVPRLTVEWVSYHFKPTFLQLVRASARKYPGQKKWVPIPAGNYEDRKQERTGNKVEYVDVAVRYQQKPDQDFCFVFAMASALHFCGFKNFASGLQNAATTFSAMDGLTQMQKMLSYLQKRFPRTYLKCGKGVWKEKSVKKIDIFARPPGSMTLLVPLAMDGGTQHAVAIVAGVREAQVVGCSDRKSSLFMFDGNEKRAMVLSKEALDVACGLPGGYDRPKYVLQMIFKNMPPCNA